MDRLDTSQRWWGTFFWQKMSGPGLKMHLRKNDGLVVKSYSKWQSRWPEPSTRPETQKWVIMMISSSLSSNLFSNINHIPSIVRSRSRSNHRACGEQALCINDQTNWRGRYVEEEDVTNWSKHNAISQVMQIVYNSWQQLMIFYHSRFTDELTGTNFANSVETKVHLKNYHNLLCMHIALY